MFKQLEDLSLKYNQLTALVNNSKIIEKQEEWQKLMKELAELTPIVEKFKQWKLTEENIKEALEMIEENIDDELKQLAKEELSINKQQLEEIRAELTFLLLPKDPNDDKNVIVEIRGGAGGDEAALFASDLFRMYVRFAERMRWKSEVMSLSENGLGGIKEVVFLIKGKGAYSRLKYESGVHRVQRIPITEAGGRIHTSTVTVAVLPEADEVDVDFNQHDIRVDVFRSSGNGGQSVNTTDSAVRITHLPTGIVISCQDEKSQLKNKDKAMKILMAKLYDLELEKQNKELSAQRKMQVGTGDRSERIRTYNFPQGRVSDHRINYTSHQLESILDGELNECIDALTMSDQSEKLKAGTSL